jgi:hypothetical protein
MTKEQLDHIQKVAEKLEDKLSKAVLTTEEIHEIDQEINTVIAEVGSYKKYFKRLS